MVANAAEIGQQLKKRLGTEVSFLVEDPCVYFAGANDGILQCATVNLIQGLYQKDPDNARRLLRKRIYSTASPTEMCLGMVKVVAKRFQGPLPQGSEANLDPFEQQHIAFLNDFAFEAEDSPAKALLQQQSGNANLERDWLQLALGMAQETFRQGAQHTQNRPVASLLVSSDNQLLAWGVNTNSRNKTLHAEVNMVQSYLMRTGRKIPTGARIYTTLKPCKMCAGMIWTQAEDVQNLRVAYVEVDDGPFAKCTVLNAQSSERKRVDPLGILHVGEIEQQVRAE